MRKLIAASLLTLAISTTALAAPPNDSSDRAPRGAIDRIISVIKRVIIGIRPLDETGTIQVPVPANP
jgi:hypothetical protein